MTEKRELVRVQGTLKGMGREVLCTVQAVKVTAFPGEFAYLDCHIVRYPSDLADGEYELTFGGSSERVRKHLGRWLTAMV